MARVRFGSMRRRSALTRPNILVELVDFAFRAAKKSLRPTTRIRMVWLREAILSCNVSPKPARKPAGVRSTPYPPSKPGAIYEIFQRKNGAHGKILRHQRPKRGSEFRTVHILQLS